jgi:hypothetical protein
MIRKSVFSSGESVALPPVVGRASPQGEVLLRKSPPDNVRKASLVDYMSEISNLDLVKDMLEVVEIKSNIIFPFCAGF